MVQLETSVAADPAALVESEHLAPMADGTQLFYRAWTPSAGATRAVVLVHRGHEHSGRLRALVHDLGLADTAFFAWDARGHGRSPGERGYAPSFGTYASDLDTFAGLIGERHGIDPRELVVVGHSVGAVIAAAWVHDYAPPVRAMVLVTPALRIRLYVPFAITGLRLLNAVRRKAFIKSYVRSGMLTHDRQAAAEYDADTLLSRSIAVNILLGVHDTSTRLIDDAAAIRVPTLVLTAGSDWVVSTNAQRRLFERLGSARKEMETYPGFYHALLHERDRHKPIALMRRFITEAFERPGATPPAAAVTPDPRAGGVAAVPYALSRVFLKTIGRLSEGIRIGWRTGFDSGQSLDHVYKNRAAGTTPLGRLIDRVYLNSPGWHGIRQRRRNMEIMLDRAIAGVRAERMPVRLLDIASGPGRYALDAIVRHRDVPVSATLRDRDEGGLAAGRAIARELGITSAVHEKGDAFDPASIATVRERPTIGIVSGLYELFPDNELVVRSLRGLHAVLESGGYFIYTNQPWHPQLRFIASVLTNRDGQPWVMRCRPQAEMDGLVAAAGFEKIATLTDDAAIFTVSLARKAR